MGFFLSQTIFDHAASAPFQIPITRSRSLRANNFPGPIRRERASIWQSKINLCGIARPFSSAAKQQIIPHPTALITPAAPSPRTLPRANNLRKANGRHGPAPECARGRFQGAATTQRIGLSIATFTIQETMQSTQKRPSYKLSHPNPRHPAMHSPGNQITSRQRQKKFRFAHVNPRLGTMLPNTSTHRYGTQTVRTTHSMFANRG